MLTVGTWELASRKEFVREFVNDKPQINGKARANVTGVSLNLY